MQARQKLAKFLLNTQQTLAIAESCTGGLLTNQLTNISGASAYLLLGIIAYDNKAKTKLLNIPLELIQKHGAVSLPVAILMAQNVRKILNTDYGIGITGIAGPTGGTKNKPIGLVYIAVSHQKEILSQQFLFKGTRLSIKTQAAKKSLEMLLKI